MNLSLPASLAPARIEKIIKDSLGEQKLKLDPEQIAADPPPDGCRETANLHDPDANPDGHDQPGPSGGAPGHDPHRYAASGDSGRAEPLRFLQPDRLRSDRRY